MTTRRELSCRVPGETGCLTHTRAYVAGVLTDEGFPAHQISEHLADGQTVVWLDLLQPSEDELGVLVDELGLHPLAVEDALHADQRTKLDRYSDHVFISAYGVIEQDGELDTVELSAFLTPRALVTVRSDPRLDLAPVLARWDGAPHLAGSGVAFLAHGLVDTLVDGYVRVAEDLDDRSDELEDDLFDGPEGDLQRRTFALRSASTRLRRVAVPMREVVATMRRPDVGLVDDQMAPYLRDVDDHVLRVVAAIDSIREQLATVLETTLAVQGQRLNQTIFRLTAYAAILAVTTAVTGYFGQNIPYPGLQEPAGFWASTLLLVGSVTGLWWYFRRKGWL